MAQDMSSDDSCWVTTFVFISGLILGAGAAILLAPEPGANLRGRLAKGAKIAQEEFGEVANETKEALRVISQDTQRTVKKAASRINDAVEATKNAVIANEGDQPSPPVN
ncbi:YtxH domain-containing protein [Candidatus Nitronereus thalassa]|uniref:YtxH domain-containing protein n=1 Tax=Candidatus Nitronereus thalassa TaxID=3020898 RepID=A0ABU3K5W7_9BACT|nr:YtxH domain-containing protein [Candidatus Nitronereus thalassa]MDT7041778.1 YtxH domain-containing protein [Candidatus Nitronereus thalassa]